MKSVNQFNMEVDKDRRRGRINVKVRTPIVPDLKDGIKRDYEAPDHSS